LRFAVGKIIAVVGNSGVGKTTLTRELCKFAPFITGLEGHEERPFQREFAQDLRRYGFANQIDYLLYRAEQEKSIRRSQAVGIQDGGLDQDFHLFTRHFYLKGYLSHEEYKVCERTYTLLRCFLPPPDLIIRLTAPIGVIAERYAKRGRKVEIAKMEDLAGLENLLDEWIGSIRNTPIITVDASSDEYSSSERIEELLSRIGGILVRDDRCKRGDYERS
jgi:deoxyadenosine/deoxycytidine kinase